MYDCRDGPLCQVITLDLIFFFYQSCRFLESYVNTYWSKRECVVIVVFCGVFHCLLQTVFF